MHLADWQTRTAPGVNALRRTARIGNLKEENMTAATLTTFSAKDAKTRFGELLDTALGRPVGITKHDRLTAYVVSKHDFESMVEKLQELEDQLWLMKADAARKEGFVGTETVDALLSEFRNIDNDGIKNNEKRSQVLGRAGR